VAHGTAEVDPEATLVGPILLGPGVRVERGAVIVGPTTVGPQTTVGEGVVLSRSVTWSRCQIGRGAVVDRCLLGDETHVPPETTLIGALRVPGRRAAGPPADWLGELGRDRELKPAFPLAVPDRVGAA
jgi:NDP-sugar pyrophosphorylase family protein